MCCTKCGTENRAGAKFCEECGARLDLRCPNCHSTVTAGKKFCGECGLPLTAIVIPGVSSQVSGLRSSPPSPAFGHRPSDTDFLPPAAYTPHHLASRILATKVRPEGERKTVSALFADIKGSMTILEDLDPEEARKLVDPCLQLMMDAVHRVGGTVNRLMGDGIMALFGAPLALEDHPQRALYSALIMQENISRYAEEVRRHQGVPLQIRVGVNTGEVVVRSIGNDLYMDYSAVGHSVGLAARMESLATPGSTLVTARTYKLTHEYFHFKPLGPYPIKGLKEPLEVYELVGPGPRRSRIEVRGARGFTQFVGREQELRQLSALFELVCSGQGQVVALVGEPGVGKSRLCEEFKGLLRARGCLMIEGSAFAYGKTRTYLPLIEMLKHYFDITDQDTPASYREKITEKLLALDKSFQEFIPFFLDLFAVEVEGFSLTGFTPELKRQKIFAGIQRLIVLESQRQPVVLLIEDLHWLDAPSLVFLEALTDGLAAQKALVLVTHRPELHLPWREKPYYTQSRVDPLPESCSDTLLRALLGNNSSLAPLISLIRERSGGNPFFMEELVQDLVESGTLTGRPGEYHLSRPLASLHLPTTVQSILASRLDRLPRRSKALAQTAAVIGKDFSRRLLIAVADTNAEDFDQALADLQTGGLIYETAVYPEVVYSFKHALTQEVAYASLLLEQRRALHEKIGWAIEAEAPDRLTEYAALLAYHYRQGANAEKAVHYLTLAGQRAFDLYSDGDAAYFWQEALHQLAALPETPVHVQQAIHARINLIHVFGRQTLDDTEARQQFALAEQACLQLGDPHLLAELNANMAVFYLIQGKARMGLTHAEQAAHLAETLTELPLKVVTSGARANLLWLSGRFHEALTVAEEGLTLLRSHRLTTEQFRFIVSPYVQCLAVQGASCGFLGRFSEGCKAIHEAITMAERSGCRVPEAWAYWGLGMVRTLQGEVAQARQALEQALVLITAVGSAPGAAAVEFGLAHLHNLIDGSSPHTDALRAAFAQGVPFAELAGAWLAEALLQSGHIEHALTHAQKALQRAQENGSLWFLTEAHTVLGRTMSKMDPPDYVQATLHLKQALRCSDEAGSLPLHARVLLVLGETLIKQGTEQKNPSLKREAKKYFTKAARLFTTLEMPGYRERAEEALRGSRRKTSGARRKKSAFTQTAKIRGSVSRKEGSDKRAGPVF